MPTCCVRNCKSRTHNNGTKGVKYFSFPKEIAIRQQWLNACQREETNIKVDSARICSIHFDESCFVLERTKPRSINAPAKDILRLKKESIPTKMLTLEKKRKRKMLQSKEDKIKVPIRSGLPTYAELVQYAQEKQRLSCKEPMKNIKTELAQNMEAVKSMEEDTVQNIEGAIKNMEVAQYTEKQIKVVEQKIIQKFGSNSNVSMETLLIQLKKSEEKNKRLLEENINLKKENRDLNIQITQLQTKAKKIAMDRHKEAEAIAINILHKVFTPGQIRMLMSSTKSRVKWSAEDIISAISLRSLSPRAYKYLRNVRNMPLPCETTLQNWLA